MSPLIVGAAPFVIFPALVFLFTPAVVRRGALAMGTLGGLAGMWLVQGPDNPLHLVTIIFLGIAAGALLIEFAAFLRGIAKGKRAVHG